MGVGRIGMGRCLLTKFTGSAAGVLFGGLPIVGPVASCFGAAAATAAACIRIRLCFKRWNPFLAQSKLLSASCCSVMVCIMKSIERPVDLPFAVCSIVSEI